MDNTKDIITREASMAQDLPMYFTARKPSKTFSKYTFRSKGLSTDITRSLNNIKNINKKKILNEAMTTLQLIRSRGRRLANPVKVMMNSIASINKNKDMVTTKNIKAVAPTPVHLPIQDRKTTGADWKSKM